MTERDIAHFVRYAKILREEGGVGHAWRNLEWLTLQLRLKLVMESSGWIGGAHGVAGFVRTGGCSAFSRFPSKELRSDCRLLTLALALDASGTVRCSRVRSGSQQEDQTLWDISPTARGSLYTTSRFGNARGRSRDGSGSIERSALILRPGGIGKRHGACRHRPLTRAFRPAESLRCSPRRSATEKLHSPVNSLITKKQ